MNRNERLNPQQSDKGISFGFMTAIIPFAASMLLEQVLFHAPEGTLIEGNYLQSPGDVFINKEKLPIDSKLNLVVVPTGATCCIRVDNIVHIVHDFIRSKSALIKVGGKIKKRKGKSGDNLYHMTGGKSIDLNSRKRTQVLEDGTTVEWRP